MNDPRIEALRRDNATEDRMLDGWNAALDEVLALGVRPGLRDDIAAMLHYRGRTLHPRAHERATGGPCDECIESADQAIEFMEGHG